MTIFLFRTERVIEIVAETLGAAEDAVQAELHRGEIIINVLEEVSESE